MKQFILETGPDTSGQVSLSGKHFHYLAKVRRLAPGEYFPALLPDGGQVTIKVLTVDKNSLTGLVISGDASSQAASLPPIYLFQALPKGDKMDLIVRQAAEGAVSRIVPFTSGFSVAKYNNSGQKFVRWQKIIKEARQQSGSLTATEISQPETFDGIFSCWEQIKTQSEDALGLLMHHVPLANESLHRYLGKNRIANGPVVLAIGPEGGFSPAEAERFMAAGFKMFTFGGTILRTETAALYAAAAVRIILMERDSWETN